MGKKPELPKGCVGFRFLGKPKKGHSNSKRLSKINHVFFYTHSACTPYYTLNEMAEKLSEKLKNFFELLNLKTNLTQLGIGREHFRDMAARATKNGTRQIGHYFPLDEKRIEEVLEMAV